MSQVLGSQYRGRVICLFAASGPLCVMHSMVLCHVRNTNWSDFMTHLGPNYTNDDLCKARKLSSISVSVESMHKLLCVFRRRMLAALRHVDVLGKSPPQRRSLEISPFALSRHVWQSFRHTQLRTFNELLAFRAYSSAPEPHIRAPGKKRANTSKVPPVEAPPQAPVSRRVRL
ncbi:hypothetical protein GQ43DRAFT_288168 [Delitschia confertaspora ATCC 74209]|uniref:Uncharacterized protein n=1 Tax=Delitschia confertaspora ATCC 74209 TaxID=1513339 RepID=A0A9P4N0N8_9PLEO|nr:hypothetical protein GQ43DRAFT_288168 [Delitschia confertaspora ATCC 74209]